jgi:hypothetical protein
MDWSIALGVTAVVGVLGALAAVLWWRLAFKRIPYKDDVARRSAPIEHNVVIIRDDPDSGS